MPDSECIDLTVAPSEHGGGQQPGQRCPVQDTDNRPLLRMAYIPRNHFAEALFTKAVAQWTRDLAWLWGTYGQMRLTGMVGPCRGENANATQVMGTVCDTTDSGLGMSYFAGRHMEVRERG